MKENQKVKKPQTILLRTIAIICILFVLAAIYLRFGPNRTAVTLEHSQDVSALQGFTLQAVAGDDYYHQSFTLENGTLKNRFSLKGVQPIWERPNTIDANATFVVSAAARAEVDKNATRSINYDQQDSTCRDFDVMITAYSGDKRVRFPVGISYHSEEEIPVSSYYAYSVRNRIQMDYSPYIRQNTDKPGVPQPPAAGAAVAADNLYVFSSGTKNAAPVLYRAEKMLTDQEVNALPHDGFVGEEPVLCASTPYGTVQTVHQFPKGTLALNMTGVQNYLYIALWEKETVNLYCMDAVGQVVDVYETKLEVPITADGRLPYVRFTPRQSADAICFAIENMQAQNICYYGLRVKDGKVIAGSSTKAVASRQEELDFEIALRADNTALLVATRQLLGQKTKDGNIRYLENGVRLAVYENEAAEPSAVNLLQCNQMEDYSIDRLLYTDGERTLNNTRRFMAWDIEKGMVDTEYPSVLYYGNY